MQSFRFTVRLKLGLIIFAVFIAVASLAYAHYLTNSFRVREQRAISLWANAIQYQANLVVENPYQSTFRWLEYQLQDPDFLNDISAGRRDSLRLAMAWARSMPPSDQLNFVTDEIIRPDLFNVPAILTNTDGTELNIYNNIQVDEKLTFSEQRDLLLQRAKQMDEIYEPIPIQTLGLDLLVHYDESLLVSQLRYFPLIQLLFVGLFIFVGYMGFSYVRRNEQSSLWVGMAKEAAHQLGTPISSMMGWLAFLKSDEDLPPEQEKQIADELEKDVARLQRVANRFSDIGSQPKLDIQHLSPVVNTVGDYIRRRLPSQGQVIKLTVDVPENIQVPLNVELFEWVIENILKNAADAIDRTDGLIHITASTQAEQVIIEISDNGRGIAKNAQKNIFKPGFSTKRRGWGLGLSLAMRIISEYHGGELSLKATGEEIGTTFKIVLNGAVLAD